MEVSDKQNINKKPRKLPPHLWQKGQSGNPAGRPKGKTLKEYAREYLACMNEDEREDFMTGLPKELIWKMAEGNPQTDITSKDKPINPTPIISTEESEVATVETILENVISVNDSNEENQEPLQEN